MLAFGERQVENLAVGATLEVTPQSGTATLSVPVLPPPGRSDLTPPLLICHRSTSGNSILGAGWSLSGLPAVGLDTSRNVPRWDGTDGFQLGGDGLVPWLQRAGSGWTPRGFERGDFSVALLRSRRGSARVRVEKWLHCPTGRVHFRTRDVENLLTIYGARANAAARIADPDDESRTLTWLPELTIDSHGNAMWFDYLAETSDGIDRAAPAERARTPLAQRYLKRIRYGNATPLALDDAALAGVLPDGMRWCFQVVIDYGDHDPAAPPSAAPDRAWPVRADAFSTCGAGFEIRTYRMARRILSFHDFPELGATPTPVAALALAHAEDPAGSTVTEIARIGYRREPAGIVSKAIPPLRLTYAPPATETAFTALPAEALANVPAGFAQPRVAFVDLLGEGLSGILAETDRAWMYKRNLGDGNFAAQALVLEKPAVRPGVLGLGDMDGDGNPDLSLLTGRFAGLYELDREHDAWENFRPFPAFPHVEALGDQVRWVDLNGDGRPDIVVSRQDRFVWYASDGDSFSPPVEVPRPDGIDAVPMLEADKTQSYFFADMNGDGLADFVHVRNGGVEYWPSLGNARFGDRVVMADAPLFDDDDSFDAARLRFADLDGSGTADLVYVGQGEVRCWINASGNRLLPGPRLSGLPYIDLLSNVRVFDFLGDGRACLVRSTPLPGRDGPLQYLPLTPADPPRMLLRVEDRLGREQRLTYSSSARHYLRDLADGRDWTTRLPSHGMVVDTIEERDLIGGTGSVRHYAYHDGYFDGGERVARGFAQVDVTDGDVYAGADPPPETMAPASLMRMWFHLGTPMWDRHRPFGTYDADAELPWLGAHVIDDEGDLSSDDIDDGLRAIAGRMIRREVYAMDARGIPAPHPIAVHQERHRLRRTQPAQSGAGAAFFVSLYDQASWTYEQVAGDPRVAHGMALALDDYDQPVQEANIAYARRTGRPRDCAAQDRHSLQIRTTTLINVDQPDRYELGLLAESKGFELAGLRPGAGGLFTHEQLLAASVVTALAAPAPHETELSDDPSAGPQARLFTHDRKLYWNDTRDAALPLGRIGTVSLVHHEEGACFSPGFLAATLGARIDDPGLAALGYVLQDGLWWQRDEVQNFAPPAAFSMRVGALRGDGAQTRVTYDAYNLLLATVTDPAGNTSTAVNDYHRLVPWQITDPNGTVRQVCYDPLGVIVATTKRGHAGDQPWGHETLDAVPARVPVGLAAALADPASLIQGASDYTWYDLDAFGRDGSPTLTIGLGRESLLHDGTGNGTDGRIAVRLTYLDGLGRSLQRKTLVEPGPAIARDAGGQIQLDPSGRPTLMPAGTRWLVSGHTLFDAKQRPIRTYQPFFSGRPDFESDDVLRQFGSASLIAYDAAGRMVAQNFPDGTFTRATLGPWRIEQADQNDTVLDSAWAALRQTLANDTAERQALEQARPHANTPGLAFLDPRGAVAVSVAQGGASAADRRVQLALDVAGESRAITDPRGLTAFGFRRDMQGRAIQQISIDAGTSFCLPNAYDRDAIVWDARGFVVRRSYDVADRPTSLDVSGGDGPAPLDHRVEEYVYGESLPDAADARRRNLLGQLVTTRDGASTVTVDRYDPDGNPLATSRQLRAATDSEPDWRTAVPLDAETITSAATYDATGRVIGDRMADGSTRAYSYLAGGLLSRIALTTPDGKLTDVPILNGASAGALGSLDSMTLGNGVQIQFGYGPDSLRLVAQTAAAGARVLQQFAYTYDPVGNIVRITDAAQEGASALIAGIAVPAQRDFTYDAHYRLRTATGRVHQGLLQWDSIPGSDGTVKGTRRISFNDGAAVERFTRNYDYDQSGNLQRLRHLGTTRNWTTDFWISTASNRSLPALDPNGNAVADPDSRFDPAGNLRQTSHLRQMEWDWAGGLSRAVVIARPGGTDDAERYRYGADRQRVVKQSARVAAAGLVEVTETAYFGDAERKRITRNGNLVLERWTLHVGNGNQRLALVHRWTKDDLAREVDDITVPRVRYQLANHQRSSVMELDEAASLIAYEEYFPDGDTAFLVGNDAREVDRRAYRYSGKERDDVTGFYYYGYRYLAPWMGRWISPDPIGPEDDLNLYQFVRGNPVVNSDAAGLQSDAMYHYGGVSSKITTATEAMRVFNNAHALELGFLVTKVERLPSGDWLIQDTKPLPPKLRATADKLHGNLELAQELEDMSAALQNAAADLDTASADGPAGGDGAGDTDSGDATKEGGGRATATKV